MTEAPGYRLTPLELGEEHLVLADVPLAASRDERISVRNDVDAAGRPELSAR